MQLFIIDRNPFVAASYLADCHVKNRARRYDLRDVHFIRITKPEDGMLFRASDGMLYGLIENECIHYMGIRYVHAMRLINKHLEIFFRIIFTGTR